MKKLKKLKYKNIPKKVFLLFYSIYLNTRNLRIKNKTLWIKFKKHLRYLLRYFKFFCLRKENKIPIKVLVANNFQNFFFENKKDYFMDPNSYRVVKSGKIAVASKLKFRILGRLNLFWFIKYMSNYFWFFTKTILNIWLNILKIEIDLEFFEVRYRHLNSFLYIFVFEFVELFLCNVYKYLEDKPFIHKCFIFRSSFSFLDLSNRKIGKILLEHLNKKLIH